MNKDKKALYNLMENYFYNCELYGYSTFESWCDDNFENEEQKRLMLEMESWVDNIAWLLFNEDLKEDLSEDNMLDVEYIAWSLSNPSYADNLQATKELIELFDSIKDRPFIYKSYTLETEKDYVKMYDDCFYTYETWEGLVESELHQSEGLTEEECKDEIGRTIWQLPCGWYVQYV